MEVDRWKIIKSKETILLNGDYLTYEECMQLIRIWIWPIISVLIAILIAWGVRGIFKIRPKLNINLVWKLPYIVEDDPDIWFETHPDIKRDEKTDVTYLDEPEENYYFNIHWREWFTSVNSFENIPQRGRREEVKLQYNRARIDGKGLGPWFFEFGDVSNVWLIFHFKDDFLHNYWCYCKCLKNTRHSHYKWKTLREQKRNKLSGLRFPNLLEPCKSCTFRNKWKKRELYSN